jgi:hypothetical protein
MPAGTRMVEEWWQLRDQTDEAAWWIRKAGGDHYAEHLDRLVAWTAELIDPRPPVDIPAELAIDPPGLVADRTRMRREADATPRRR